MKHISRYLTLALVWSVLACGDIEMVTNEPGASPSTSDASIKVIVHVSDFLSSALISTVQNISSVGKDDVAINVVSPLPHTDARLRASDGWLYIINRFGRDSIQIVDLETSKTLLDFSTGSKSNPGDIAVISKTKAYVSLYQSNDLLVVNPTDGTILKRIDLAAAVDDDGEKLARADRMARVGSEIWVLLQDLDKDFKAVTNGKIAVIDTTNDTFTRTITLLGRNPNDIAYVSSSNSVYVSMTGPFDSSFTTDTSDSYGGIELVNATTHVSSGIVIDDKDLGGYPGRIEIAAENLGFVVTESKRIVSFNPVTFQITSNNIYESPGTYLPEILSDGSGHLLVAERGDSMGKNAGLVIFDTNSGFSKQGPIDVGGPPNSLTLRR